MPLAAVLVFGAIPALAQEPRPEDARPAGIEAEPPEADTPTAPATEQGNPSLVTPEAEQGNPPPAASTTPNPGVTGALFVLDDIVVEGAKHGSAEVVVSETLLAVGQSYSEAQLQQALNRVQRLPFVVKAEFALRKGSDRGRFLLVVTISETWPVFAGADLTIHRGHASSYSFPEVGARVFLRGHNELKASFRGRPRFARYVPSSIDPDVAVTFTRHNLFSKRLVGSGTFQYGKRDYSFSGSSSRSDYWQGAGNLALAVTRASVLEVDYSEVGAEQTSQDSFEATGPRHSRDRGRVGTLGWRFDCTDDPFVPRGGTRLALRVSYSQTDASVPPAGTTYGPRTYTQGSGDRQHTSVSAQATRVWPLKWGLSLMGKASLAASDVDFDGRLVLYGEPLPGGFYEPREEREGTVVGRIVSGGLEAGLLGSILRRPASSNHFWWEMAASSNLSGDEWEAQAGDFATRKEGHYVNGAIRLSVAARGRWGTARLSFELSHTLSSKFERQ